MTLSESVADFFTSFAFSSLPGWEVFEAQPNVYKLSVLPSGAPVMSVEAYNTLGWSRFSHEHFGLEGFGMSGPGPKVYEHFEITPTGIASRAKKVVDFYKKKGGPVVSPLISALNGITEA
jgi:transketolase